MATYVSLLKWTDKGREEVSTLADRVDQVSKQLAEWGVQMKDSWTTMGQYDQIVVLEASDDGAIAKALTFVAGRGYATSETLRAWSMDEVRSMQD